MVSTAWGRSPSSPYSRRSSGVNAVPLFKVGVSSSAGPRRGGCGDFSCVACRCLVISCPLFKVNRLILSAAEEGASTALCFFSAVFRGRGCLDILAAVRLSRILVFEIEAARHFAAPRLDGEEQIGQLVGVLLLLREDLLHHQARDRVFLAEVARYLPIYFNHDAVRDQGFTDHVRERDTFFVLRV